MVRVIALAGRLGNPAFRYRVGQFIEPLRAAGIDVECRAMPGGRTGRIEARAEVGGFDIVWLLRRTLTGREAQCLHRHAQRLIFDLDDAIWLRDSNRLMRFSGRRRRRFARTVRAADLVLAGNDYLARQARRLNESVEVVPTCVEADRYRPRESHTDADDVLNLVWIGQASTLGYLEGILGALEALAARRPARLHVIADIFPTSRRIEVVPIPWSAEAEVEALAAADVGLAPLTNDRWARGKCGLKVLQYMASGLPVVASPVGVQAAMIGENERGRLAASPDEWVEHLTALADDATERERCGQAGRAFVEEHYSVAHWAPRLAQVLRSLLSREGRPE